MKILITTDLFTTETNGVVTSVKNLVAELTAKGHDVRILTFSDSVHSHKDGTVYYIRSMPIGFIYPDVRMPLAYRHRFVKELIRWKPDVIHSQCEFFSYQFALYISKHTGAPIVHTYHTLYEQYATYLFPSKRLGNRVVRTVSRRRLKRASTVIAPTPKVEDALRGYGLRNAIRVVPSGISLEQHKKRLAPEKRESMRQALGIRKGETVLLNLGRLGTEKNLAELVRLFAKALRVHPELVFLIVGDGPARADLEALATELGVKSQVIFTGMVPPSEVQNYYQLGDIFVSASTSETQGLTYIEAAANGLPLLCRADPCLRDVLHVGKNGYTYTNEAEFLQNLATLLASPQKLAEAGKESEKIADTFDKKAFGAAIEHIYKIVK